MDAFLLFSRSAIAIASAAGTLNIKCKCWWNLYINRNQIAAATADKILKRMFYQVLNTAIILGAGGQKKLFYLLILLKIDIFLSHWPWLSTFLLGGEKHKMRNVPRKAMSAFVTHNKSQKCHQRLPVNVKKPLPNRGRKTHFELAALANFISLQTQ